jgi:cellulose synthase/poly-beta-1,6-N-acetylglucosamine synthase-like glycosyltransferase
MIETKAEKIKSQNYPLASNGGDGRLEIPFEKDRGGKYRFFEILPGTISWTMLALPFILSFINVTAAAAFVLVYLLINFTRAVAGAIRALEGFRAMRAHQKFDWLGMIKELEIGKIPEKHGVFPKWHYSALKRYLTRRQSSDPAERHVSPDEIIHAVIIATYKESREILEPTIQSVLESEYDMKKVLLIMAYEERGGPETAKRSKELVREYGGKFMDAFAVGHPNTIPGEIIGKGGNVTFAGRELQRYLEKHDIDPLRVLVTTLDSDNRPDRKYLAALSYVYSVCPDPVHASFQPVAMYTNNIWDAPAPMRVLATGNSFFNIVVSLRQHALRNFSSHAQPMAALIQTDFWSVRTIVEDGHQFWRSYFAFEGNYRVYPLYVPICQDAVLAEGYVKTLKAQFIQLRRWTYGASDIAYVANQGFFRPNKVPRLDLLAKFWRLLEGHITWAVGPLLILGGGFIPAFFHPQSFAANELPLLVSRIQTVALVGLVVTIFFSLITLPPKPARYKRHRTLFMLLQWVYLPLTTIIYNSFAAFYSQTRLMFGKYISKFDVTEKAVMNEDKKAIS